MNTLWGYFWPLVAAGLLIGAITGIIAFRLRPSASVEKRRRTGSLAGGIAACFAAAALWSGPLGAADRLTHRVESDARLTLDNYEMTQVTAHLHRAPLTRRLILSGPADDLQRSELSRILGSLSGVSDARWSSRGGVPLIVESAAAALLGFLFGLLLAYLVELRRRYNAQWNW